MELYILNGWIVWYVIYNSKKKAVLKEFFAYFG